MKAPYCEDVRKVGDYEVAFVGIPFDTGTTYRPGTRFGPQAVRRISAVYDGYSVDGAVDLFEELDMCDAGDVFVIPGNIEKTFDQVTRRSPTSTPPARFRCCAAAITAWATRTCAASRRTSRATWVIIHVDRHIDMQDMDMDERMHTTPWFWTTHGHESADLHSSHRDHSHMHDVGLSNCPPKNLVQMGIGGWYGSRRGSEVARERGSSVLTMTDIEELGIKGAAQRALELAWKDAKAVFLSYDIDSIDPGFAPGTGHPGARVAESARAADRAGAPDCVSRGCSAMEVPRGLAALRRERHHVAARVPGTSPGRCRSAAVPDTPIRSRRRRLAQPQARL